MSRSIKTRVVRALLVAAALMQAADTVTVQREPVHLRAGDRHEWRAFPGESRGHEASFSFTAEPNNREFALLLRQRDVRNTNWTVTLNDRTLGVLTRGYREMTSAFAVPTGVLVSGRNVVRLTGTASGTPDDIEIREVRIASGPVAELLQQATLDVSVRCDGEPLPVKITITDPTGALVPFVSLPADAREAIRTGVLYTADGNARFGLIPGTYRVYASRGFEYSAPSAVISVHQGKSARVELRVSREVVLNNYVSADPHIHTLELSGHGDSTVNERALTAAGEGLDIAIATEHDRPADYADAIRKQRLERWVVSVPGSEVTTATGHFNIFPVVRGTAQPDPRQRDTSALLDSIWKTEGVRVVQVNHPRDDHSGYTPFDPRHHLSSIGENLQNRPFSGNAMEVVNAGAMNSFPMQLVHDWLGLLTRGLRVAAIGSTDTHTVSFVPVGQARTYIDTKRIGSEWRDRAGELMTEIAAGNNLVSYGLAAQLEPASRLQSTGRRRVLPMTVTVWGPSWSRADRVMVFSNGILVWQQKLNGSTAGGKKFSLTVQVPVPTHDADVVAVATGPGVNEPFWEVVQPSRPTSDELNPMILGISRVVRVDADGDGKHESPLDYARRITSQHRPDSASFAKALADSDAAVASHAANLLRIGGADLNDRRLRDVFFGASPAARQGYERLLVDWQRATAR